MTELTAHHAAALRDLYYRSGPYATVYFDVRATRAADAWPRWRAVAAELARQGAGPELVEVLRERVLAEVPGPGGVVVIAADGRVLPAVAMPDWVGPNLARFDGLPHLLPLLQWLQSRPAYVAAVVDRTGADITLFPGGAGRSTRWSVSGPDDEIERNAPGGWAQARYQRRAEDSWEYNAVRVVEELVPVLRRHAVRLLVLAGDLRAVQYLEKHMPAGISDRVVVRHVSGGRAPDGSAAMRAEEIQVELGLVVAERTAALLAHFDEERCPGGRAVEGAGPTLEALAEGRVRVLLLVADSYPERTAWFGSGVTEVAAERDVSSGRGHRSLPHTADLRLLAWAPTRDECVVEAVTALGASVADARGRAPSGISTVDLPGRHRPGGSARGPGRGHLHPVDTAGGSGHRGSTIRHPDHRCSTGPGVPRPRFARRSRPEGRHFERPAV